jgi:hypothetical protein
MGMVSEVVYDGDRLLQGFPDVLGPSLQPSMEHLFQVVVTIAILKHHSNLFAHCPSKDTM